MILRTSYTDLFSEMVILTLESDDEVHFCGHINKARALRFAGNAIVFLEQALKALAVGCFYYVTNNKEHFVRLKPEGRGS